MGLINSIDKKALNAAKDIVAQYATVDADGKYVTTDLNAALEDIDVQLAIVDVVDATTPTRLNNAIVKLNGLLDTDKIDIEKEANGFYDANAKRYISGYKEDNIDGLKAAEVNTV